MQNDPAEMHCADGGVVENTIPETMNRRDERAGAMQLRQSSRKCRGSISIDPKGKKKSPGAIREFEFHECTDLRGRVKRAVRAVIEPSHAVLP
jgi:hypothetical protein